MTPAKVIEAVNLIKIGKIYQLAGFMKQGMPLFGSRHYSLTIPGGPTGGPWVRQSWYIMTRCSAAKSARSAAIRWPRAYRTLIGNEVVYYNGLKQSDVGGTYGLQKLGIHNVGVFFTRGILLDVLAYKGGTGCQSTM